MRNLLVIVSILLLLGCEEVILEEDLSSSVVSLVAPADNAELVSSEVSFHWESINNASEYHFQIAQPSFATVNQLILDSVTTTNVISTFLTEGNYEWRVRGKNSAYTSSYTIHSLNIIDSSFENETVMLTYPENGGAFNEEDITMIWNHLEDATNYILQIWSPSNTGVLVHETSTEDAFYSTQLQEGTYEWFVYATNDGQQTEQSSSSLIIDTTPPNIPTLVSPADGLLSNEGNIQFTWQRTEVLGSSEIDSIYIFDDSSLTSLVNKDQVVNQYTLDLPASQYYWYMQSFDAAGNESDQTDVNTFTVN